MKEKTEKQELQQLIMTFMQDRDKTILLFEKEPVPKRLKKLQYYKDQIAQCQKDKIGYHREIKAMKEDFKHLLQEYDSKALTHKNILNREKEEALQVN